MTTAISHQLSAISQGIVLSRDVDGIDGTKLDSAHAIIDATKALLQLRAES